ncbi:fructosamine kinase family protein [Streptomyces sp. TRM66268-LWL]|uniref:Fructosamine kinase family protein n=1 Tax=Streptomyces polyasparticus TaxID=2767826 RepID=A0ABR7SG23_9ACTN|nr:fructosamine kinase family protein [Streptomyces polyasparticus]MBC9713942.1 fructosamine kinase family protein [Streptomyces polyasparticus]
MSSPTDPAAAAALHTGAAVSAVRAGSGALRVVELVDGRTVMVKENRAPQATRAEATGLMWLADAESVRVPTVFGWDERWLVTERVVTGGPDPTAARELGRGLARLHTAGAPAFGAPPPGGPADAYIGQAPMHNSPGVSWPVWYAEQRVLPYLRRAVDEGTLRPGEARAVEELCDRLPDLAGPAEPPARLHGDLWNGNVLWGADGHPYLIDPAAHGGHRETDLAMLDLFGCPYLPQIVEGYEEIAPLRAGRPARIGLHQLFPLLVHTVLFGRGYAEQALAAARSALLL